MNRQTPVSDAGVAASRPVMGQEAMLAGLAVLLVHLLVRL